MSRWRLIVALLGMAMIFCYPALAKKAKKPKPPKPDAIPAGYVADGNCMPDGFDAKTGQPSILRCTQKNGDVTVWRNPMRMEKKK